MPTTMAPMGGTRELARFLVVLASNFPMGVTGFGDAVVMHIMLTLCALVRVCVWMSVCTHTVQNIALGRSRRFLPQNLAPPTHTKTHTYPPVSKTQHTEFARRLPERRVRGRVQPHHRGARGHGGAERAHREGHQLAGKCARVCDVCMGWAWIVEKAVRYVVRAWSVQRPL